MDRLGKGSTRATAHGPRRVKLLSSSDLGDRAFVSLITPPHSLASFELPRACSVSGLERFRLRPGQYSTWLFGYPGTRGIEIPVNLSPVYPGTRVPGYRGTGTRGI
eukprot:3026210-Rhodomonas_salina.2